MTRPIFLPCIIIIFLNPTINVSINQSDTNPNLKIILAISHIFNVKLSSLSSYCYLVMPQIFIIPQSPSLLRPLSYINVTCNYIFHYSSPLLGPLSCAKLYIVFWPFSGHCHVLISSIVLYFYPILLRTSGLVSDYLEVCLQEKKHSKVWVTECYGVFFLI